MDVLVRLRSFAVRGDKVDDLFPLNQRTRWLYESMQKFEIEVALDGESYRYQLGIGSWGDRVVGGASASARSVGNPRVRWSLYL
jgi:hypothetical protein